MNDKKRTRVVALAFIVLATVIASGLFVVPDIIQQIRPSNVRFDETSLGQLYNRVPLDYSNPIDDLLVVVSSGTGDPVPIRCYKVMSGFDVVSLVRSVGISYDMFTYSVYGIVAEPDTGGDPNKSPTYRFLFQSSTASTETWYMSRPVIPSYEYTNPANQKVVVANEGISVGDILNKINDILRLPFI
jgi:hypothetical protein